MTYLALVSLSAETVGVNLSIVLDVAGSMVYLAIAGYLLRRRTRVTDRCLQETARETR